MTMSVEQQVQKARATQMQAFVDSLPRALQGPIVRYEDLMQEMSLLEKIVEKLKGFVEFLSKLKAVDYLNWMQEAYSNYSASKETRTQELISNDTFDTVDLAPHDSQASALKSKQSKLRKEQAKKKARI